MKKILYILVHFQLSYLFCEQNSVEGLLFNSIYDNEGSSNSATSLRIPSSNIISYDKNLSVEFDVFFWRKNPFGFILSAGNTNEPNLFVLSYSDYKSTDTSYIELTYADRPSIISIPILDKEQGWGQWKNIKLFFESEQQRVGLSFQNQKIIWYKENIPPSNEMQFAFGSTSFVVEPPRMAIKNILISRDSEESIIWKLNENNGNVASSNHENGRSWDGKVSDGVWIKEMHNHLKPVVSHKVYSNKFQFIGVDDEKNEFIYLLNDSLFYFNNQSGKIIKKLPFSYIPENNFVYKYHPTKKLIFATHGGGGGPISYFNQKKNNWENYNEGFTSDGLYYTSSFLYNYLNQDIYSLGGYGWYEQKNILQKYNHKSMSWEKKQYVTENSSLFFPRCKATVAYDYEKDKYFLYGGGGNESGKQQQGFRELNDFWVLDLNKYKFKRIWKDSSQIKENNSKFQKIAISPKFKLIYKIIGDEGLAKDNSLVKNNEFEVLVSSFEWRNFKKFKIKIREEKGTNINILHFQNLDMTDELLVIYSLRNSNENSIVFSTIKTPLIPTYVEENSYASIVLMSFISCGLLFFFLTTRWSSFNGRSRKQKELSLPSKFKNNLSEDKGLSIKLLNKFEIINKGKTISNKDWKSKKARDLFVLIILKGKSGASLDEIHKIFWPDVSLESARNSRAVALSHIRKILASYENLLVSDEEVIKFNSNNDVFIDYRYLQHLIKISKCDTNYGMSAFLIFNEGRLAPSIHSNWIKPFRSELFEHITKYARGFAEKLINNKDWEKLGFIGNKLLLWNSFHDDGLRYSVLANRMLEKNALSHKVYTDFTKNYEMQSGEKYPLSFDRIISSYKTE